MIVYYEVQVEEGASKIPAADFGDGVLVDSRSGGPLKRAAWISECSEARWLVVLADWE